VLEKIWHMLWGTMSREEVKKFAFLTLIFLFITATYGLLHPLKEALFVRIVGRLFLPYAKIASFFFTIPLLLIYAKLVDSFKKHQLFYILFCSYIVTFLGIAYALTLPAVGLLNTVTNPNRLIGWVLYLVVESFSSLVFSLFWSFVVSITNVASAERGYPFIIAGSQIGSLTGPEMAKRATSIGIPQLIVISSLFSAFIIVLVKLFITRFPAQEVAKPTTKQATGAFEGLRLLVTKPYLMGIFAISTLNEIIQNIIEYNVIIKADQTYKTTENVVEFLGMLIQSQTLIAFLVSFLGTSYLLRNFGITFSLLLYPLCSAVMVICIFFTPSMWTLFGALILLKGLNYSLNTPCKEILYIQTSTDIKFKTKSWIDGFGRRLTKTVGASFNALFASTKNIVAYSSLFSLGIIGVWITLALFVGITNDRLIREEKIIE